MSKTLAGFLLLLSSLGFLYAQDEGAVVFMYHRFGDDRYPSTNIRLEQFDAQLDYLQKKGYSVWPLSKIVRHIKEGRPLDEKTVALTIDDAYTSVYANAHERLKAKGYPYTVFVNTSSVDVGSKNYMTWDQMRIMQKEGAEFANHSSTHDYLMPKESDEEAEWQERVKREIEHAQKRLHEELGESTNENPRLLSYPFGEYTLKSAEFIESLGYIGVTQSSGPIGQSTDTKAVPRFPMSESFADMEGFLVKLNTLAFPIKEATPKEPMVVKSQNPPSLKLSFERPIKNMGCYNARGEAIDVRWVSDTEALIQAKERLEAPRDKYTCTAPAQDGRWYWYSHLWIIK